MRKRQGSRVGNRSSALHCTICLCWPPLRSVIISSERFPAHSTHECNQTRSPPRRPLFSLLIGCHVQPCLAPPEPPLSPGKHPCAGIATGLRSDVLGRSDELVEAEQLPGFIGKFFHQLEHLASNGRIFNASKVFDEFHTLHGAGMTKILYQQHDLSPRWYSD